MDTCKTCGTPLSPGKEIKCYNCGGVVCKGCVEKISGFNLCRECANNESVKFMLRRLK